MQIRTLIVFSSFAAATLSAQPRRANISGGLGDHGKCTIEVVVDGTAEVEVRGDTAVLRNLDGRQPEWRRFVCNTPMPPNPADFRFAGVDGRGRQELVREPRNGSPAVVRISDREGGSEGYTFDLIWRNGEYSGPPTAPPPFERPGGPPPGRPEYRGGGDDDRDRYYRDREESFRGDWRARFFERVRDDIDHAERFSFPGGGDRYRLDRTRQELNDLQREWAAYHRYSRRDLNDVIDALGRVVRDNRLGPRERDILNDDLNRLRNFR